jgi:hypothetical protein
LFTCTVKVYTLLPGVQKLFDSLSFILLASGMPKLKRKSVLQRNAARRLLMRDRRSVSYEIDEGDSDVRGCSFGDSVESVPDGPTDLHQSVPDITSSAVRPASFGTDKVLGACKQMEVKAHLFQPSGSSVHCTLLRNLHGDLQCDFHDTFLDYLLESLLNELLDELIDDLLNDIRNDSVHAEASDQYMYTATPVLEAQRHLFTIMNRE